MEEPMIDRR